MTQIPDEIRNQLSTQQYVVLKRQPPSLIQQYLQIAQSQSVQAANAQLGAQMEANFFGPNGRPPAPQGPQGPRTPGMGEQLAGVVAGSAAGQIGQSVGGYATGVVGDWLGGGSTPQTPVLVSAQRVPSTTATGAGGGTAGTTATSGGSGQLTQTATGAGSAYATSQLANTAYTSAPSAPQLVSATRVPAGQMTGQMTGQASGQMTGQTTGQMTGQMTGQTTSQASGASAGAYFQGAAGAALVASGAYGLYDVWTSAGQTNASGSDAAKATAQGALSGSAIVVGASMIASAIATGASSGSYFGPWGTVIGAVIGGIIGLGAAHFGSDKDKYQVMREKIQDTWVDIGLIRKEGNKRYYGDFMIHEDERLPDGRRMEELVAGQGDGRTDPFKGPNGAARGQLIGDLNPLNVILIGDPKSVAMGQSIGVMYNMLVEGGELKGDATYEQVYDLYLQTFGSDRSVALQGIQNVYDAGNISEHEYKVHTAQIHSIYDRMEQGVRGNYGLDPTLPEYQNTEEDRRRIERGDIAPLVEEDVEAVMQQMQQQHHGRPTAGRAPGLASPPPSQPQQPQQPLTDEEREEGMRELGSPYARRGRYA